MKKIIRLISVVVCLLASYAVAVDYDNDGVNDDPYRPEFIGYAARELYFFIDLSQPGRFYSLTLDNDSLPYTFTTTDGFVRSNDNDGILLPLEMGSMRVTIHPDRLTEGLRQDIASGALQLMLIEEPEGAIVNSTSPITIYDNSEVAVNFTVANVTPLMNTLPFTLNLYNTSSGSNILIQSAETGQFLHTADDPFGHIVSINTLAVHGDISIVSADPLILEGWAFDDNEDMSVTLFFKRPADATDVEAVTAVNRYIHPINAQIPYWGDTYKSGFTVEWDNETLRGYYDLRIELNDGARQVSLPTKKIFWNKPPNGELLTPGYDEDITATEILVSGTANDLDVDLSISAYLSSVEVYINSPSNMIQRIINPEPDSSVMEFQFIWDTVYDYPEGSHTIYAIAYDSFGLSAQFGTRTITIFKTSPVIISIVPRLGPWRGNTVVSITGSNLTSVNNVQFGSVSASIIPGTQTNGLMQVQLPQITDPASMYVDVTVSNPLNSHIKRDGYRFVPAELGIGAVSDVIADIQFNNITGRLYLLNKSSRQVDIYEPLPADELVYASTGNFAVRSTAVPLKMDISKEQTTLYVIYENLAILELFNLQSSGSLIDSVTLHDNEGNPVNPVSLAYIMYDTVIIGTAGHNAARLLIARIDTPTATVTQVPIDAHYDSVEVISSSNQAVAYIVAKDYDTNSFDVFIYEGRTMLLTELPAVIPLNSGQVGEVSVAPNYNGSEFLIYTSSDIARFDSKGSLTGSGLYGAGFVTYDNARNMAYIFNSGEQFFTLINPAQLDETISHISFPDNVSAYGTLELDWTGEKLFAVTPQGIATVKVGDIYPRLSISPSFVQADDTIAVVAQNAGHIPENINFYINDQLQSAPALIQSDNDTHTFSVPVTLDEDTSGKVSARLWGYASKEENVYMMSMLFDRIADMSGLETFKPGGMFFDDVRSDLYIFDPWKSTGTTIARFHISIDDQGVLSAERLAVPASIQVPYPVAMSRTNDFILAVSRTMKRCYWFNVETFDDTSSAPVLSAMVSPYITISGVVGYSPKLYTGVNYAYVWNQLSTGGPDVYQINLDTQTVTRCNFISPRTTDIIIDYSDNPSEDRAYAVSYTTPNKASDFITIFNPAQPASLITPLSTIQLQSYGGAYQLASNDEALFASLRTMQGVSLVMPDHSGGNNHVAVNILENSPLVPQFITANNDYLVLNGPQAANAYALSFIDVNIWNDYPADSQFDGIADYVQGSSVIYDMEIIGNKLFTIIGEEIYVIDLLEKQED